MGIKLDTEAANFRKEVVGERSILGRRKTERTSGLYGSEDAGTSSDKISENLIRRKPKVSWGR